MKKLLVLLLPVLLCLTLSAQEDKMKTTIKILDKVEMRIPNSFSASAASSNVNSFQVLKHKKHPILLIYELGLFGQPAAVDIPDNDIPAWADKQLTALRKSATFRYIDDGIFLQDGKNIGYIKYKTEQKDGLNTYNLLFFMSVDGKLFQVNFNCPLKLQQTWEPIADEIANSLRIIPAE